MLLLSFWATRLYFYNNGQAFLNVIFKSLLGSTSSFMFSATSRLYKWKNSVMGSLDDIASTLGIWSFIKQWVLIFYRLFPF